MARPGIEPRTSDLRVRRPTDCATRLGFHIEIEGKCGWIIGGGGGAAKCMLAPPPPLSNYWGLNPAPPPLPTPMYLRLHLPFISEYYGNCTKDNKGRTLDRCGPEWRKIQSDQLNIQNIQNYHYYYHHYCNRYVFSLFLATKY